MVSLIPIAAEGETKRLLHYLLLQPCINIALPGKSHDRVIRIFDSIFAFTSHVCLQNTSLQLE